MKGPHQKFCDAIVSGLNGTEAYAIAYPRASRASASTRASRLLAADAIKAEIARLRAKVEETAGSTILTVAEKRALIARIVRVRKGVLDGCQIRVADKLKAIVLDNVLAGTEKEPGAADSLDELLREIRQ